MNDDSRDAPVELGCDVVHETSLLRYEIEFEEKAISRETLTVFDESSETKLIDRQPSGEVRGDLILRGDANRLYVKEMQPNVAVLSKLAQHGPRKGAESAHPYYRAIRNATRYEDYSNAAMMQIKVGDLDDERFADDPHYREWIMDHFIRSADVGICDVETRRESLEIPDFVREQFTKIRGESKLPDKRVVVSFVHEGEANQPIDFSVRILRNEEAFQLGGRLVDAGQQTCYDSRG